MSRRIFCFIIIHFNRFFLKIFTFFHVWFQRIMIISTFQISLLSFLFRYMAPELLDSSERYPPADIFSLGLTLYEACSLVQNRERVAQGLSSLPSEGPDWHTLRHGQVRTIIHSKIIFSSISRFFKNFST